jgi:leucyl aminopeptidase
MPLARLVRDAKEPWRERLADVPRGADLAWPRDVAEARVTGARAAARWLDIPGFALDARGAADDLVLALAEGAVLRAWRRPVNRKHADPEAPALDELVLVVDDPRALAAPWRQVAAGLAGAAFARDLIAEPSNTLTPAGFIERLEPLRQAGVAVEALEPAALRRLGMGALLAVGSGSAYPPRLAVLRWKGRLKAAPVAFVGKGITFDTGGICIKPADGMWDMRADMAGAAACAGAMLALARRNSPCPAVAVLPLAENATGAASYRPSDVLQTCSGRTVEVVDTDAEGRLVLADALSYAARTFKPRGMIDLATLTGSIVIALGHEMAGQFGNDDALGAAVRAAGDFVRERLWPMPIGPGHREDINSDIADLRHCLSGRFLPDACHAAAFLREFAEGVPWAHLDIAGVEAKDEAEDMHAAGPTGFGARLLDALVRMRFESAP